MDKKNYSDLLEALEIDISVVIIAVVKEGTLIDWVPAAEYSSLRQVRSKHDWPADAKLHLLYGLDALLLYGDPPIIKDSPNP